jgi:hypothetical protein
MKRSPNENDPLIKSGSFTTDDANSSGSGGLFGYRNTKNLSHSAFQTMVSE